MILSQKVRKGRDSPFFPHPTYLHTQEVTGSSPVVSTKKFLISSTLYLETRYFNDNYSICRIYVFSVHLGNGPLKFLILGTQQKINQMHDTYTIDISSSQVIHGHNVLGIVVFDFQQVYDFPVRGVG